MAFTDVVKIATDANYDSGTEPWSGNPTKRTPIASILAKGTIPNQGLYGQYFNYLLNNAQSTIEVIQSMIKHLSTTLSITLDDTTDNFLEDAIQSIADTSDAATLATAQGYADTGDSATLATAQGYADTGDSATLEDAIKKAQIYHACANTRESENIGTSHYNYCLALVETSAEPTICVVGSGGNIYTGTLNNNFNSTYVFTAADPGGGYTDDFKWVVWTGATLIAVGENGGIRTDSNGTGTWTTRTPPSSYTGTYAQVIWIKDLSLAIAIGSGGAIHTSTSSGVTWTARTYPAGTTGDPVSIAYGNGVVCIRTDSGDAITSTNGTSWTRRATVAGGDPSKGGQLTYANGYFICVAGTGTMSRSSDGSSGSWESISLPTYDSISASGLTPDIKSITSDGSTAYAIAQTDIYATNADTIILITFDAGDSWQLIPNEFDDPEAIIWQQDRIFAAGHFAPGKIFVSPRLGQNLWI